VAIEWDEEKMTTGFSEIDAQHMEWIRRIIEFTEAMVSRKGQEVIQSMLDFLFQYTETHFANEEALMKHYNLPVQEQNRAAHNDFRVKLAEIRAWVKTMVQLWWKWLN